MALSDEFLSTIRQQIAASTPQTTLRGTVQGSGGSGVTVLVDGSSQPIVTMTDDEYVPSSGDRVYVLKVGDDWVLVGKIVPVGGQTRPSLNGGFATAYLTGDNTVNSTGNGFFLGPWAIDTTVSDPGWSINSSYYIQPPGPLHGTWVVEVGMRWRSTAGSSSTTMRSIIVDWLTGDLATVTRLTSPRTHGHLTTDDQCLYGVSPGFDIGLVYLFAVTFDTTTASNTIFAQGAIQGASNAATPRHVRQLQEGPVMGAITTTTTQTLTSSHRPMIDRHIGTGRLFAAVRRANSNLGFWYSTDNGTTWTDTGTANDVATGTSALEFSFFLDRNGNPSVCYRTYVSGKDTFNIKYGAMNTSVNGFLWYGGSPITSAAVSGATGTAGGSWQGLDHVTVQNPGSGGAVLLFAVAGAGTDYASGGAVDGCVVWAVAMSGGTYSNKSDTYFNLGGDYRNLGVSGGAAVCAPPVDFKSTGDGKNTAGQLDITVVELAGDGNFYGKNRWIWNGNGFTSSFDWISAGGGYPTNPSGQVRRQARIDAQGRLLIPQLTGNDTIAIVEYDASYTTRTSRYAPAHPKGTVTSASVTYDTNGNIYLFAVGTADNTLEFCTYARSSGTWTAWSVVNATVLSNAASWGVRRGTLGSRLDSMTQTGSSTLTLASQQIVLTGAPFAPTWNAPTNNSAQNVSASLLLDWVFSDPDVADAQSAYALSRQIGAGSLAYWRASDSTWQPAEVQNTSAVDQLTLASWASGSDANYTFRVKVWDQSSTASPYSSGLVVTPSVLVNPTITAPTSSGTVTAASVTVTWTATEQTAYHLLVELNVSGVYTSIFDDTGTTATSRVVTGLTNGAAYRITLTTRNNEGLQSTAATSTFTAAFTPPPTPTITFPAMNVLYAYVVGAAVTNPAGSPAASSNTVERRIGTDDTTIVILTSSLGVGGTYYDAAVSSGVSYQYRATAYTTTGALAVGAWTV